MAVSLRSAPGRAWVASSWPDEAGVVFDRNSGDFWVVPDLTLRILLRLEADGTCARGDLVAGLAADGSAAAGAAVEGIVDDLLARGLIVPAGD